MLHTRAKNHGLDKFISTVYAIAKIVYCPDVKLLCCNSKLAQYHKRIVILYN